MKHKLSLIVFLFIILCSCKKKTACINGMKLNASSLTPTIGDTVIFTAPKGTQNEIYNWSGPAGFHDQNQLNTITISGIKLSQAGMYSCAIFGNSDCPTLSDSVLIQVKLKQETPPCTLTTNLVTSSSAPNSSYFSVTKGLDPTFNGIALNGYAGLGYINIKALFNSYNGNTEPRDGTHISTDKPIFDPFQEPNEISLSFVYNSNYYHSRAGNKVYVTHVNGKLQVSFCNIQFASPPFPTITCSGKMTEL
jgi:hypothetical protein